MGPSSNWYRIADFHSADHGFEPLWSHLILRSIMNPVLFNRTINPQIPNIKKMYDLFGWKWYDLQTLQSYSPSEKDLKTELNKIYNELMSNSEIDAIECGRLSLRKIFEEDCKTVIGLDVHVEIESVFDDEITDALNETISIDPNRPMV